MGCQFRICPPPFNRPHMKIDSPLREVVAWKKADREQYIVLRL